MLTDREYQQLHTALARLDYVTNNDGVPYIRKSYVLDLVKTYVGPGEGPSTKPAKDVRDIEID